jgi:hypothetical protein
MKNLLLLFGLVACSLAMKAQVGISDSGADPDPNAALDISSSDKGLLPPRVALSSTSSPSPVGAHVEGMVVYNTATAGDVTPGLYYNNGSEWVSLTPSEGGGGSGGSGGFTHYVGELYGGGIVFHVYRDALGDEHGLIASLTDVSTGAAWSNVATTEIGPSAKSTWNGPGNTNAIVSQAGHTGSAAQLCLDYANGGFDDWYLPSLDEVNMLYNVRYNLNKVLSVTPGAGELTIAWYWSSTETSANNARGFNFTWGSNYFTVSLAKTRLDSVRAVRHF